MLLVELFLAVDGFLLCTISLSKAREEGKAPALKAQLKVCQMQPPLRPPTKENARRYICMATFLMTSCYLQPSIPGPTFPNGLCTPRIEVDDKYQDGGGDQRVCFYSETLVHSLMYSCIHKGNTY